MSQQQVDQQQQAGQQPDGNAGQPAEMIPRSEAQKAFEARDQAKQEARALREELERLKAPPPPPPPKQDGEQPPAWAQAILEQQQKLEARLNGEAKTKQRNVLLDDVLSKLPESNRKLGRSAILGMEAEGGLKLDDPSTTVDAVYNALKSSHGTLFVPAGSSASAIQVGPDGKINWDSVNSAAEVPPGAWKDMPPEKFKELTAGAGSNGALKIRGGR